eukprot:1191600-Prorocentrum_minimum.AAC.2
MCLVGSGGSLHAAVDDQGSGEVRRVRWDDGLHDDGAGEGELVQLLLGGGEELHVPRAQHHAVLQPAITARASAVSDSTACKQRETWGTRRRLSRARRGAGPINKSRPPYVHPRALEDAIGLPGRAAVAPEHNAHFVLREPEALRGGRRIRGHVRRTDILRGILLLHHFTGPPVPLTARMHSTP